MPTKIHGYLNILRLVLHKICARRNLIAILTGNVNHKFVSLFRKVGMGELKKDEDIGTEARKVRNYTHC